MNKLKYQKKKRSQTETESERNDKLIRVIERMFKKKFKIYRVKVAFWKREREPDCDHDVHFKSRYHGLD